MEEDVYEQEEINVHFACSDNGMLQSPGNRHQGTKPGNRTAGRNKGSAGK